MTLEPASRRSSERAVTQHWPVSPAVTVMLRVMGYEAYRHTGIVDSQRRFSLARAIANREHRAVVGLAIALLLMAWKATYNGAF